MTMDTVLIVVTLISLALAGGMSVLVVKMLREERRRSDARVAALLELAAESGVAQPRAAAPKPPGAPAARRVPAPIERDPAIGATAPRVQPLDELEIRPAATLVPHGIFAEPERRSAWGLRLAVIGVLLAAGAALLLVPTRRAPVPADPSPAVTRETAAPLELVSMRHTQDRDTLTISGVVHNPKTGAALTRVEVTAVAVGPDGALLAHGRAPLDYTSLAAGDESPFVVTVPVRGTVARYRIGFRSEDGGVVAHVDRRTGDVSRAGM